MSCPASRFSAPPVVSWTARSTCANNSDSGYNHRFRGRAEDRESSVRPRLSRIRSGPPVARWCGCGTELTFTVRRIRARRQYTNSKLKYTDIPLRNQMKCGAMLRRISLCTNKGAIRVSLQVPLGAQEPPSRQATVHFRDTRAALAISNRSFVTTNEKTSVPRPANSTRRRA